MVSSPKLLSYAGPPLVGLVGAGFCCFALMACMSTDDGVVATAGLTLATLEAETMTRSSSQLAIVADGAASGGKAVLFWSAGQTSTQLTLSSAASGIQIRARGDQCNGAPQMVLKVDGVQVFTAAVTATSWTTYAASTALSAGTHSVVVSYANDYYVSSSCDRNLRLDRLDVTAATTGVDSGTAMTDAGAADSGTVNRDAGAMDSGTGGARGTVGALEAESATPPASGAAVFADATASGGRGLVLYTNGTASAQVTLSAPASRFVLRARGDACTRAPHVVARVDGATVLATDVGAAGSWVEYAAPVALTAGAHTVTLSFDSDSYVAGSCDGNLRLDLATFLGDASTPADAGTAVDSGTVVDASTGSTPSGQPMPVGDIPGWHQVFADDFTTDVPLGRFPEAVGTRWGAYANGWHDTSGHGLYDPHRVISVAGGAMRMHIHTENGVHLVSTPYPRVPGASAKNGLLYGRYVARFRADALHGYKTAWLLWPDSETWPRDGEIDFPEGNLDGVIEAFMHRMNGTSSSDQDAYRSTARYPSWHTAVIEWTPTACRFILDGATLGASTSRIPSTAMHWVLQTETALDGTIPSDSTAGNVEVDWVAVYVPR